MLAPCPPRAPGRLLPAADARHGAHGGDPYVGGRNQQARGQGQESLRVEKKRDEPPHPGTLADILRAISRKGWHRMGKSRKEGAATVEALRPYVKRALEDPDLRDDLLAAFVAAKSLYGQLAKGEGVKGKAEKVSDKQFQRELQELVSELTDATDRLQGKGAKKSHKTRNRVILLTGVTLGVLYNPWTGPATREWIMERISGGNGDGLEEYSPAAESPAESPAESAADATSEA
jgi:hypothetical protein